jgi:hypothetical protein
LRGVPAGLFIFDYYATGTGYNLLTEKEHLLDIFFQLNYIFSKFAKRGLYQGLLAENRPGATGCRNIGCSERMTGINFN